MRAQGLVSLPREIHDAIVTHARFCHPHEACGLIAVDENGSLRFVYALTNRARSAHRYLVDPTEHFRALQHAESAGWQIGAVFHSHPGGLATPSATDVEEARDPSWLHLIVADDQVRAWRLDAGTVELTVALV